MAHHDALTALPNRILLRLRMEEMICRPAAQRPRLRGVLRRSRQFQMGQRHARPSVRRSAAARRRRAAARRAARAGHRRAARRRRVRHPAGRRRQARRGQPSCWRACSPSSASRSISKAIMVTVGASIGVALAPGDGDDPDRLLKNADMALYRAKAEGKGASASSRPRWTPACRRGGGWRWICAPRCRTSAFEVHYQPLVNLATGEVRSLEALIRWPHPERGMIPPSDFIPVAEETGLIAQLGLFVLRRACADAAQWPDDVKVAVNLSPMQFKSGNLLQAVRDALKRRRPAADAARAGDHRNAAARQERAGDRDAARAARARRPHLDGRFRHRLFVAELSAQLSVRQDQDRPLVRARHRRQRRLAGDRARDRQPGLEPRHHDHRRRRRDRKRSGLSEGRRLHRRAGLSVQQGAAAGRRSWRCWRSSGGKGKQAASTRGVRHPPSARR